MWRDVVGLVATFGPLAWAYVGGLWFGRYEPWGPVWWLLVLALWLWVGPRFAFSGRPASAPRAASGVPRAGSSGGSAPPPTS